MQFPFPVAASEQRAMIATIADGLDKHRKDVQAAHPEITLTQMYNVLEKVKAGVTLDADDKLVHDNGLILILKERHDELDAAVAEAYGWPVDLSDEDILARLVALNKERAAEEAKGLVRWLRPEYQIPRFGSAAQKQEQLEADLIAPVAATAAKASFPTGPVEQTAAVMHALSQSTSPLSATEISMGFKQGKKALPRVEATLSSLLRTGFIYASTDGRKFALRKAA